MNLNTELYRVLSGAFRPEQWTVLLQNCEFVRLVGQMQSLNDLKRLVDDGRQLLELSNDDLSFAPEQRRLNSTFSPLVPTETRLR